MILPMEDDDNYQTWTYVAKKMRLTSYPGRAPNCYVFNNDVDSVIFIKEIIIYISTDRSVITQTLSLFFKQKERPSLTITNSTLFI